MKLNFEKHCYSIFFLLFCVCVLFTFLVESLVFADTDILMLLPGTLPAARHWPPDVAVTE